MTTPVICFGQQPCGFFPRRYLYAKIQTARRLQREIGGEIVYFFHDSDHDPRETKTTLRHKMLGEAAHFNFEFGNKIQKKYSPLYRKRVDPRWQQQTANLLPEYVVGDLVDLFDRTTAESVADFCLEMYRGMGLMDGIRVARSSDPEFRRAACKIDDFFVDVPYEGETVRARHVDGALKLHKGGDAFITLPEIQYTCEQISPARDTRLRWMQSVVRCTHYVAGASEIMYLNRADALKFNTLNEKPLNEPTKPMPNSDSTTAPMTAPILAFGAHPDDIEFACGGIIAKSAAVGQPAHFVVCSRGEAGSYGNPELRMAEAQQAARILGATVEFLELDGDAHLELRVAHMIKLASILRRVRPQTVLAPSLVENQHPDHFRLGQLVRDATRLARYGGLQELRGQPPHVTGQLFYYALSVDAEPRDITPVFIDVSEPEMVSRWQAAMEAHASQTSARNYVELQLTRAKMNGLRCGVAYAAALYPNDPLVFASLADFRGSGKRF